MAEYLVRNAADDDLQGAEIIRDYGAFKQVRLTNEHAHALAADGAAVENVNSSVTLNGRNIFESLPPEDQAAPSNDFFIIALRGPAPQEWMQDLHALGAETFDYVPNYAVIARLSPESVASVSERPYVRQLIPFHPAFKVDPRLAGDEGRVRAIGLIYKVGSLAAATAAIREVGASVLRAAESNLEYVIEFEGTRDQLAAVARIPSVSGIVGPPVGGGEDIDQGSALVQSATTTSYTVHSKGIDGSTQRVSVCDHGLFHKRDYSAPSGHTVVWITHNDLNVTSSSDSRVEFNAHRQASPLGLSGAKKVVAYYVPYENEYPAGALINDSHGTHVAATLAGDNATYGSRNGYDGVAYASKLVFCGRTNLTLLNAANFWAPAVQAKANLSGNSYGGSYNNAYTLVARQEDDFTWNNRSFLLFRSAGNLPATIRAEAVAKNVVAVGASENKAQVDDSQGFVSHGDPDSIWAHSSKGPAADGRTKPNVIAPGACITAAWAVQQNQPYYNCHQGTSMSTPTAVGAGALIRDYLKKGFYPGGVANTSASRDASAALVRGMLQISGKKISDGSVTFPNSVSGWGRIMLDDVLYFSGDSRKLFLEDEQWNLSTGQSKTYTFTVNSGQPLRIMLTWTDRPALANAVTAIVNDLNLKVQTGLTVYRGNN